MDSFDFLDEPRSKRNWSAILWNVLTILVLILVACVLCLFLMIFINPYSFVNPFPPTPLPTALSLPTATPTSIVVMPATWTPTNSPVPTLTNTPQPTSTLPPTLAPVTIAPTPSSEATMPQGGYPFQLRQGSPKAIPNIYHPELGCNWMGVGGQTVDMSGGPVTGLIIRLGGVLPGVGALENMMSLTGVALDYGRAGYEFKLADRPVSSRNMLWVQLLNQVGGALSDKVYFDTYDSCDANLIIIDFRQVR